MSPATFTTDEIRAEIKKLIARVTEREPDEIPDEAHYMEELGWSGWLDHGHVLLGAKLQITFDTS